jgi:hypothetical protein
MKSTVTAMLRAAYLAGAAALAVLIVTLVVPGYVVAHWVLPQPRTQAIGGGISWCHELARAYSNNPNVRVPMHCMDSMWMPGVLPRGYVPHDAPPGYFYWPCCDPPPDAPPPRPPGDEPRVPDEPGDAPPPPDAPEPASP